MAFTPAEHKSVAWGNLVFLGIFVVVIYNSPVRPVVLVSSQLETTHTLTHEEKVAMISNSTEESPAEVPLSLHFTNHEVELAPFVVFMGLLISMYSLLSAAWLHNEGGGISTSVQYDLSTVGTDATSVLMDVLFWALFAVFHGYVYLALVRFCLRQSLALYVTVVLGCTWLFANRAVQRYIPAIFCVTLLLCCAHAQGLADVMERENDNWLGYFILFVMDATMLLGHTFDEMLTLEVALNCRISYVCCVGVYMTGLILLG
jgi:hypothetical protein